MTREYLAIIKATGKEVLVYRHREGGYVNSSDLNTKYKPDELELIKQKK